MTTAVLCIIIGFCVVFGAGACLGAACADMRYEVLFVVSLVFSIIAGGIVTAGIESFVQEKLQHTQVQT
jgi:hypothetical protein